MSNAPKGTVWPAEPHTIAKIKILEAYLKAWFGIMGSRQRDRTICYIDGFAGPGSYSNFPDGSPVVALKTAVSAKFQMRSKWIAGDVQLHFVEKSQQFLRFLKDKVNAIEVPEGIHVRYHQGTFAESAPNILKLLRVELRKPPVLFSFIDPFGATGVPFSVVKSLLSTTSSEVLMNFDADGIGRIFLAGESAAHERHLDEIFGDTNWKNELVRDTSTRELYVSALDAYKKRLKENADCKYVFPFEMKNRTDSLSYFLLFASNHERGLEKMKEAMKTVDQDGSYCFSDAVVMQPKLFRFDNPEDFSKEMERHFEGQTASFGELKMFALEKTPFVNPKSMLKVLEEQGKISITSLNPKRRRGTFSEESTVSVVFHGGKK